MSDLSHVNIHTHTQTNKQGYLSSGLPQCLSSKGDCGGWTETEEQGNSGFNRVLENKAFELFFSFYPGVFFKRLVVLSDFSVGEPGEPYFLLPGRMLRGDDTSDSQL